MCISDRRKWWVKGVSVGRGRKDFGKREECVGIEERI